MSKNQGTVRSKEEIQEILQKWQQSGLSKKLFCTQHQINYQTFIGWCIQQRNEKLKSNNSFVQVEMPKQAAGVFAELQFDRGRKIILHHPVSVEGLVALLKC
jgi:hypothetical protein